MLFPTLCVSFMLVFMYLPSASRAEPLHAPIFLHQKLSSDAKDKDNPAASPLIWTPQNTRDTIPTNSEQINLTSPFLDYYYCVNITIGTPPQTFVMIVDTGSADIVVANAQCPHGCTNGSLYDSSKSSTAVNKSSSVVTRSSSNMLSMGYTFTDTVSLGSYLVSEIEFLSAAQVSQGYLVGPMSGVLGLGGAALSRTGPVPFWETLIAHEQLGAAEFSFWFGRSRSEAFLQDGPGGALILGGVNTSLYSGEIEFLPSTGSPSRYWTLKMTALTVQGQAVEMPSLPMFASFDTGSSIIQGPPAEVAAIWALVPGAILEPGGSGIYVFPCGAEVNITVAFGGRNWPINPVDIILGHYTPNISQCVGAIVGRTPVSGMDWSFGTIFLKNVYSVFRQTPAAIGFAELSTEVDGGATPASVSSPTSPATSGAKLNNGHVHIVLGGVLGAVAAILVAGLFFFLRNRHRKIICAPVSPFYPRTCSFVVDHPTFYGAQYAAPNGPETGVQTSLLFSMKRAQMIETRRYGDPHTEPDVIIETLRGHQLMPGQAHSSSSPPTLMALPAGALPPILPSAASHLALPRSEGESKLPMTPPPGYEPGLIY